MLGLIVTGHGHFATGMGSALWMIAGDNPKIQYVDFEASDSTQVLQDKLLKAMDALKETQGVLIMADLLGGSPFKTAVECSYKKTETEVSVLAGTNLPMLVEAFMQLEIFDHPADLADALTEAGKRYICKFEMSEDKREEETQEDGI